jgi:acetolactate decarboxylase
MSLTRWQPEKSSSVRLVSRLDWPGLLAELERQFPSPNLFYALRVEGRFESVRARSVRRQEAVRHVAAGA